MKNGQIGVIGGGLIGMSWSSLFLARGYTVTVVDPRDEVAEALPAFVERAWPALQDLGLTGIAAPPSARVTPDITALRTTAFVQECGPDRIEVKREMLRALEDVIAAEAIVASSTSSLLASDIQRDAQHPERILVAHPMNPPHLVPMVELVAGKRTSEATMQAAEAVYANLKRVTIRVQKEVVGHLANRLTSALYREAVYAVQAGIASVEDVDKAIAFGPGMRWAIMGPHLTYHLGGGSGGYRHYLDHLGPTQEARWREHGMPELSREVKEALIAGIEAELETQDEASLIERRDAALVELAQLKRRFGL